MSVGTFVQMPCPNCQQHDRLDNDGGTPIVDTRDALSYSVIANGIQWHGVPCHACRKTYTIESLQDDK